MKIFLNFIFIFCFALFTAQNKSEEGTGNRIETDYTLQISIHKENHEKYVRENSFSTSQKQYNKKDDDKKMAVNQDFDQEIRAILDYRVNRVLREDFFCLVCEIGFDEGQMA